MGYSIEKYKSLKEQGLCTRCGRGKLDEKVSTTLCKPCFKQVQKRFKTRYYRLRKERKCFICTKDLVKEFETFYKDYPEQIRRMRINPDMFLMKSCIECSERRKNDEKRNKQHTKKSK